MERIKDRKIVYMGTPHFAVRALELLLEEGFNIAAVVTAPDRAVGRGLRVKFGAVKEFAIERDLPLLQPHSLKEESFIEELKAIGAELFIVVAFRMLPKEVWSLPPLGCFNLHASLLPQYRGAAPINWAIINGERKSGVTTFLIDHQIDTGNILLQEEISIGADESVGSLHDRMMEQGGRLVVKSAKALFEGSVVPKRQHWNSDDGPLKGAPKLSRESGSIDWRASAKEIHNLIRGLSPYPAAHALLEVDGREIPLKIFESKLEEGAGKEKLLPGEIVSDRKSYLTVGCGEGSLSIESLQLSGRKRVEIAQFLAGFKEIEHSKFVLKKREVLILADGEFPSHPKALSKLREAESIICCDGAADRLLEFSMEPTAIVGDMDSISREIKERYSSIIFKDESEEYNDLTKGFNHALKMGADSIIVLGGTGKREDHTLANISLIQNYWEREAILVKLVSNWGSFELIVESGRFASKKGEKLSFFSLNPEAKVRSKGLKYPLDGVKFDSWWRASLNICEAPFFEIELLTPTPLILYRAY